MRHEKAPRVQGASLAYRYELAFICTAHYWTVTHPDLSSEDDVRELLSANDGLALCCFKPRKVHTDKPACYRTSADVSHGARASFPLWREGC